MEAYQHGEGFNEVVLHLGKVAHMIEFEVYIDEVLFLQRSRYQRIIATPTGSTVAYSPPAGHPTFAGCYHPWCSCSSALRFRPGCW